MAHEKTIQEVIKSLLELQNNIGRDRRVVDDQAWRNKLINLYHDLEAEGASIGAVETSTLIGEISGRLMAQIESIRAELNAYGFQVIITKKE